MSFEWPDTTLHVLQLNFFDKSLPEIKFFVCLYVETYAENSTYTKLFTTELCFSMWRAESLYDCLNKPEIRRHKLQANDKLLWLNKLNNSVNFQIAIFFI